MSQWSGLFTAGRTLKDSLLCEDEPLHDDVSLREAAFAPWRPRAIDANVLAGIVREQEREERLFGLAMARAGDPGGDLAELFELAIAIGSPNGKDNSILAKSLAEEVMVWRKSFDPDGNPLWISLSQFESEEKEEIEDENKPGARQSSYRNGVDQKRAKAGEKGRGKNKETGGAASIFWPSGLRFMVKRLFGRSGRQTRPASYTDRAGKSAPGLGIVFNIVRLAFLGACIGVIYHMLVRMGLIGRLF